MSAQPRQMMWEFTPPHGVQFQQWQHSFRVLFKEDRLEEMLAWFKVQLQLCEDAAAKGLFYNEQPRAPTHQPRKNRDRERPVSIHGSSPIRRREPRRGEDDSADPDSPPPPKRAERRQATGGNVQADNGPMPSMTPGMAKPVVRPSNTGSAAVGQAVPGDDRDQVIAALKKKLAELTGEEVAPDTQRKDQTMPPPAVVEEEEQGPDLSGPKVNRHRWTLGRYEITAENTCAKCGAECTGTEDLCPVA